MVGMCLGGHVSLLACVIVDMCHGWHVLWWACAIVGMCHGRYVSWLACVMVGICYCMRGFDTSVVDYTSTLKRINDLGCLSDCVYYYSLLQGSLFCQRFLISVEGKVLVHSDLAPPHPPCPHVSCPSAPALKTILITSGSQKEQSTIEQG